MSKLSISEVIKRNNNLAYPNYITNNNIDPSKVYTSENRNVRAMISALECWRGFNRDVDGSVIMGLEVFDRICKKGNINDIKKASNIIKENMLGKVRDATQTQTFIKRKLSYIKTKISTKINNKIEDIKNAVSDSLPPTPSISIEQVIEKELTQMMDILESYTHYDRIINNHNKISKRYNIDLFVKENMGNKDTISDCILEFCSFIDTYDIPTKAKYHIALENIMYAFKKNGFVVDNNIIIEHATNYFLMNNLELEDMINIIENTRFYNEEDFKDITKFYTEDVIFQENDYINKTVYKLNSLKVNPIQKLIFEFKKGKDKSIDELKSLIRKMFTYKNADDIINETHNVFYIIFAFYVLVLSVSIYPILGVITFLTQSLLTIHLQRKECKRVIAIYKSNRDKADKKMRTLKSEDGKERCKKYVELLDKDIRKLEDYYNDLLDDEERFKDDVDADFDFNEGYKSEDLDKMVLICESLPIIQKWDEKHIISLIEDNINNITIDDIYSISEFSITNPTMLNPKEIVYIYENHLDELRKQTSTSKYVRINCVIDNINSLNNKSVVEVKESTLDDIYNMMIDTTVIRESLEEYNNYRYTSLNEMNFTNTIKLTIERLKKSAQDLSDKEKIMSRTIDSSLETIQRNIEKALTQENREAVVKNNILPPVSKIIKLGITTGVAWMINPVLAVITLLGSFALNAKVRRQERQLIVDELEVELQMIEKYIRIAEDKNDMKGLKNLLLIQKKLQAQEARIKYKIKIETDQPVRSNPIDRD